MTTVTDITLRPSPYFPSRAYCGLDASVQHASTCDFDEQAALLKGWNQHYSQISSGSFSGTISEVRFEDVHLFLEFTSLALFQSGKVANDVVALGIPLHLKNTGVFCGGISRASTIHVFSGKSGFEFFSPEGLVMAGISVSSDVLMQGLEDEEKASVQRNLELSHLLEIRQEKIASLRDFINGVFALVGNSPELLDNASLRQVLRMAVRSNLIEILLDQNAGLAQNVASRRWKILSEARELMHQNNEDPISVIDVCQALDVSRRTLQYVFQDTLGVSPATYLRAERLNRARHMLRRVHSVTQAAVHCGFWHLGRFSKDYEKMFGELPSHTFRRFHASPSSM